MRAKVNRREEAKVIELHEKQFEAFDFKTQFCAAIAGVRGGKTFVGAVWAGEQIANRPGNGLITAPDYKTLNDATLNTFFQLFPQYRKFYKQQKSLIELPDKTIFLRSLDNPLSPEGITASWAWGDEAGKYKLLAWTVLRSRVSLVKGPILLTTTPYNMGWLYQDFFIPWQRGEDPDLTVVSWRSVDNPFFPSDVYEAEKKRLPPAEFKRRYEGVFERMQGLVYNLKPWHLVDHDGEERAEIVLGGIDWGFSNPAALIVIKIIDGAYFIVDEWYETGKTTGQIIDAAIAMQNKWGVNRWYADSANPEKIAEANTNTGLNVIAFKKNTDSITSGVGYIQQCLLENRLFVRRGLKNILAEFETYQYPEANEDGKVRKDEPMPFDNHLMDAMRYAIMGFMPARRPKIAAQMPTTQDSLRRLLEHGKRRGNTNEENYL